MADIRIKDLPTTATQTASDDFIALDGTVNGTRKIDASAPSFKTSVTSPSVAAPITTNLTLAGGSTGASLVLGQGASGNATLNVTNLATIVPSGIYGYLSIRSNNTANYSLFNIGSDPGSGYSFFDSGKSGTGTVRDIIFSFDGTRAATLKTTGNLLIGTTTDGGQKLQVNGTGRLKGSDNGGGVAGAKTLSLASANDAADLAFNFNSIWSSTGQPLFLGSNATLAAVVSLGGNLLIGTTTDIAGSGGLKVAGTTAASSTTSGALQVSGGVGVGGAGYFGSNVVSAGYFSAAPGTGDFRFNQQSFQRAAFAMGGSHIGYGYNSRYDGSSATVPATDSTGTMSSIASTTSGISIFTNTSQVANTPGVERFTVSSAGLVNVTGTTSASSSTVGALTIGNGTAATNVAIGGGKVNIGDPTASTGPSSGALQVAGGIYSGAASYFGGDLNVTRASAGLVAAQIYNSTSGTGAISGLEIRANNHTGIIYSLSDAFTSSGQYLASGTILEARGSAGLMLSGYTSGPVKIWAANGLRATFDASAATFAGAVTGPSLTAPASTNLTLAGGTSGASLVLGQGASGGVTLASVGSGPMTFTLTGAKATFGGTASNNSLRVSRITTNPSYIEIGATTDIPLLDFSAASGAGLRFVYNNTTELARLTNTGNLLIGTTADSGNGKLQLATNATSAGGIGFGADTAFYRSQAGGLNIDAIGGTTPVLYLRENNVVSAHFYTSSGTTYFGSSTAASLLIRTNNITALTLASNQAATFAGAVAINNTVATAVAVASTHKVTMIIGGVTYYLLASNV